MSPDKVLLGEKWEDVEKELSSIIGRDAAYRADIASVIATRVINYSMLLADKGSIPPAIIQRIAKLTTDCDSFTDDLRYYMIKEIVNGNKNKFSKLMMNSSVVKMAVK
jgi:hypothetical protein